MITYLQSDEPVFLSSSWPLVTVGKYLHFSILCVFSSIIEQRVSPSWCTAVRHCAPSFTVGNLGLLYLQIAKQGEWEAVSLKTQTL